MLPLPSTAATAVLLVIVLSSASVSGLVFAAAPAVSAVTVIVAATGVAATGERARTGVRGSQRIGTVCHSRRSRSRHRR